MRLHAMKRNMSDQQTTEQKQQSGSMELHCTPKIKIFQGSMIHATQTRPAYLHYQIPIEKEFISKETW
jgi:hypothetical protein